MALKMSVVFYVMVQDLDTLKQNIPGIAIAVSRGLCMTVFIASAASLSLVHELSCCLLTVDC